jgi:hypothetical protein
MDGSDRTSGDSSLNEAAIPVSGVRFNAAMLYNAVQYQTEYSLAFAVMGDLVRWL